MTTFTWKIAQLERRVEDGFVTQVHYRVEAQDDTYNATVYGVIGYQDISEVEPMIPYEELTEETVIGWVKTSLSESTVEAALQAQIDAQKDPVTLTGTPWSEAA